MTPTKLWHTFKGIGDHPPIVLLSESRSSPALGGIGLAALFFRLPASRDPPPSSLIGVPFLAGLGGKDLRREFFLILILVN
jgi:hypothetical protein